MGLFRVKDPAAFDRVPEVQSGVHLARVEARDGEVLAGVAGGCVVVLPFEDPGFPLSEYLGLNWLMPGRMMMEERVSLFRQWLQEIRPLPAEPVEPSSLEHFARVVTPKPGLPPPPAPPASIYGHLPFTTATTDTEVFYRWEAFPQSRRIDRTSSPPTIAAGTFAGPQSEVQLAPTGFSAVARFALPTLLPACFRWELQPEPCTIECGASVPLYGQSGGGVEVMFASTTRNRCAIADPVVLPPL